MDNRESILKVIGPVLGILIIAYLVNIALNQLSERRAELVEEARLARVFAEDDTAEGEAAEGEAAEGDTAEGDAAPAAEGETDVATEDAAAADAPAAESETSEGDTAGGDAAAGDAAAENTEAAAEESAPEAEAADDAAVEEATDDMSEDAAEGDVAEGDAPAEGDTTDEAATEADAEDSEAETEAGSDDPTASGEPQGSFEVLMGDLFFDENDNIANPPVWTVASSSDVDVTLLNEGSVQHNWAIVQQGEEVPVPFLPENENILYYNPGLQEAGTEMTVTFTAPEEAGTYTVICTAPGHYPVMQGLLEVQ